MNALVNAYVEFRILFSWPTTTVKSVQLIEPPVPFIPPLMSGLMTNTSEEYILCESQL